MHEANSSIILIHFNKNIDDLFYFDKNKFDKIINFQNIKDAISFIIDINKDDIKKTVIDISEAFSGKIINFLVRKNKQNSLFGYQNFLNNNILLKKLKEKLNHNRLKLIKTPIEYVDLQEKNKTLDYINWNMKSSGYNEIRKIRYIYIILEENKKNGYLDELEILGNLCSKKNNLKVIFTFTKKNREKNEIFKEEIPENIKKYTIGVEFWSCEENFIINLIENSRFVVTDDKSCNFYCNKIDIDCLLIDKKKSDVERKINLDEFENKISFLIKNCI